MASGKAILLLGSGRMTFPVVEYLINKGHSMTIASNLIEEA
jgi:hypothetical protein